MTVTAEGISDRLTSGFRSSLRIDRYGDGHLLVLPQTYASGTLLSLLVVDDGETVSITDRGLTAEQLEDEGVDIERAAVQRSWGHIQTSTGLLPAMGAPEWELTAVGPSADLSIVVQAVADAAMRADGLRVLSKRSRRLTFGQRILRRVVDEYELPAQPRATLPGKHGAKRQVTCKIEVGKGLFVQALSGRDSDTRTMSFDHAMSLFSLALVERAQLIAVLEDSRWDDWQTDSLGDLSRVVADDELHDVLAGLN